MEIFTTLLPFAGFTLLGFLISYQRILTDNITRLISAVVLSGLIPLLLFFNTATAILSPDITWSFISTYYGAVIVTYLAAIIVAKRMFSFSPSEQSVFGMGASYSNTTIIGIPICLSILGKSALLPLMMIISIHNLALFSIGLIAAERNDIALSTFLNDVLRLGRRLLTNPVTVSLIAGLTANLAGIQFDILTIRFLDLATEYVIASALVVLGFTLKYHSVEENTAAIVFVVSLKLIFFPLVVWIFLYFTGSLATLWGATILLTAALPTGINAFVFANQYNKLKPLISSAIVISTAISFISLNVISLVVHL